MAIAGLRRRHVEEEGESVFVSMTDLTVSFLFILLVLLAFFATQIQPDDMVPRSEHEALKLELSEAHAAIIRFEQALAIERERLERLEQERRALADRLAEANDTKRQLEEALANERRQRERLEQENLVLTDRLAEAHRTITELRALVDALRAELAVATTTIDDISAQVAHLQRDVELLRTERNDARARVELLLIQVEHLTQSLADCRRDRDRLRMQLAEMIDPDSLAAYVEDGFLARERLLERLAQLIRHSIPGSRSPWTRLTASFAFVPTGCSTLGSGGSLRVVSPSRSRTQSAMRSPRRFPATRSLGVSISTFPVKARWPPSRPSRLRVTPMTSGSASSFASARRCSTTTISRRGEAPRRCAS